MRQAGAHLTSDSLTPRGQAKTSIRGGCKVKAEPRHPPNLARCPLGEAARSRPSKEHVIGTSPTEVKPSLAVGTPINSGPLSFPTIPAPPGNACIVVELEAGRTCPTIGGRWPAVTIGASLEGRDARGYTRGPPSELRLARHGIAVWRPRECERRTVCRYLNSTV